MERRRRPLRRQEVRRFGGGLPGADDPQTVHRGRHGRLVRRQRTDRDRGETAMIVVHAQDRTQPRPAQVGVDDHGGHAGAGAGRPEVGHHRRAPLAAPGAGDQHGGARLQLPGQVDAAPQHADRATEGPVRVTRLDRQRRAVVEPLRLGELTEDSHVEVERLDLAGAGHRVAHPLAHEEAADSQSAHRKGAGDGCPQHAGPAGGLGGVGGLDHLRSGPGEAGGRQQDGALGGQLGVGRGVGLELCLQHGLLHRRRPGIGGPRAGVADPLGQREQLPFELGRPDLGVLPRRGRRELQVRGHHRFDRLLGLLRARRSGGDLDHVAVGDLRHVQRGDDPWRSACGLGGVDHGL